MQRHCVELLADICRFVQILGAPVPVDQFVEILKLEEDVMDAGRVDRHFQVFELVIEVPKTILDDIPTCTSVPEPQTAKKLVKVPTVLSVTRSSSRLSSSRWRFSSTWSW